MALAMRGQRGELRKGFQAAASLGAWTLTDGQAKVTVESINDFWFHEPGRFSLWLVMGRRAWIWAGVEVQQHDGNQMALQVVGSPEVRDAP